VPIRIYVKKAYGHILGMYRTHFVTERVR